MPLHDTLFVNGTVVTMNPVHPQAEAVLVRGDRVVAVGLARRYARTRRTGRAGR